MNKDTPKKYGRFQFTMDHVLHVRLKKKAAEMKESASAVIDKALRQYLKVNA